MARTITLVLLGGGVVLGGATMLMSNPAARDRQRACQEARGAGRPDAEQICAGASSSRHYHGGSSGAWFFGRSGGGTSSTAGSALVGSGGFRTAAVTSARGGFGSTARGFSSSGS
jgi:hypothetical protein